MKKKLISLALALIMVLSLFSVTAFASPPVVDEKYRGTYSGAVYGSKGEPGTIETGAVTSFAIGESAAVITVNGVPYNMSIDSIRNIEGGCQISFSDEGETNRLLLEFYTQKENDAVIYIGNSAYYSTIIEADTHTHVIDPTKHHDAVAPNCTDSGSVEYWECTVAGCYAHLDKDGKKIKAADFIIPALDHDFSGEAIEKGPAHCFKCVRSGCSATGLTDFAGRPVEGVVESHTNKDNDHKCDVCGCVMSECADDEGNDHLCDVCGKKLTDCIDEEGDDGLCDICGEPMPTEPELPGFIGWIVSSMLRIVKLILARITLENLKPAIIGGAIVKVIEDAFAR